MQSWGFRCGLVACALVSFSLNARSANASFVEHGGGTNRTLVFLASDFETNTVSISLASGVFTVTDSTAVLTAGGGCAQVDDHTATCVQAPDPINIISSVYADLDDMNDSATTDNGLETEIHGGNGDDVLSYAGTGSGFLFGDDGDDTLTADSGDDDGLDGGPGDDRFTDGAAKGRLLGGDGQDILRGGGARDCLLGGAGVDALNGDAGSDLLHGGTGNDVLRGSDGNDVLKGAGGFDSMFGGSGKDGFASRDDHADKLSGGPGLDRAFLDRTLDTRVGIETLLSGRQIFAASRRCF
jgi:Ca2+-binding RTX toxin-like protein